MQATSAAHWAFHSYTGYHRGRTVDNHSPAGPDRAHAGSRSGTTWLPSMGRHTTQAYATVLAVLTLLLWVLLPGCSLEDPGNDEVVEPRLGAEGPELVQFIQGLTESARARPESAQMRGRLGMGYDANGFSEAAQVTYAQAESLDPTDFRWPYYRALALAQLNRYEEALASLDRAIAIDSTYASAWLWRGAWLLDLDRHEEAAEAYGRVGAAADPLIAAVAKVGIARALMRQGRPADAVLRLESAAADYPRPAIMRLLANAYRRVGRIEDMRRLEVGEAVSLRWPDKHATAKLDYVRGFNGRMFMVEDLIKQEKAEEALKILEPLREKVPNDSRLLSNLNIAYSIAGRKDDSFEALLHGLEVHPDSHTFHYNIAVHYDDMGKEELALHHLNRALELHPALKQALQRKISLLTRSGRFEEASATADAAIRSVKADPGVLFYAGLVAGALERWPQAIEHFQQAISLDPGVARVHLFLGRSLAEAGRFGDAQKSLEQAQQLGVETEDIVAARRRLQYLEGQAR